MRALLIEIASVARYHHLVCLLEILFVHEVVGYLGGQGVESHALKMARERHVARYLHHLLEREHHLDCRTQLRALCGHVAVETLVTAVHALRLSVETAQVGQSFLHGTQIFLVLRLLVIYHWLLQSLRQIDAMDASHACQFFAVEEHSGEVVALGMQQRGKPEQLLVARYVVKPVHRLQVVACAVFRPERPVAERFGGKSGELVMEISCHEIDDTPVLRGGIVLLHYLQHHHAGPPVG